MESRSTFVTVLAWIFIVGAGFLSVMSVLQAVMVSMMFSGDEFSSIPESASALARFMSLYFHLVVYGLCALSLFTLVASVAFLKRKNWARVAFIVILSLGVLWQVAGLIMQFKVFSGMPTPPAGEGLADFERMTNIIHWFSVIVAIAISGLFVWIIKKLSTQPIIGEFAVNNPNDPDGQEPVPGT